MFYVDFAYALSPGVICAMRIIRRVSIVTLLSSGVLFGDASAAGIDAADAAFVSGRHERALELYDEVLVAEPDNTHALFRSARLLSWNDRIDEALARYERILATDPTNRPAAIGHATVLSWDGQLDASVAEFESLLEQTPGDREIMLGLARSQNWDGRHAEARAVYDELLLQDPGDVEALLGVARTYAWSGDLFEASDWYERALAIDPGNKDAAVGLGYLDLWSGNLNGAARRAADVERRFPDDKDAKELGRSVRNANAPSIRTSVDRLEDTDDNELSTLTLSGGWGTRRGLGFTAGYAHYAMQDPLGEASIDSLFATLNVTPAEGQALDFRLGLDRAETTTGETNTNPLGGVGYVWGLDRRWQVRGSLQREAVRYSPTITDNNILFDSFNASASTRVGERWRINAGAGFADFSDGNSRQNLIADANYRLPVSKLALEAGAQLRYMDYAENPRNGYFSPQDFTSMLLQLRGNGTFGARKFTYSFYVAPGLQSFSIQDFDVNNDLVLIATGTLGFPLGKGLVLELFANRSDYAAVTPAGFESRQLGLRLRWQSRRG
jgi:tetratricopeptide (TPR) repeat protein